MLFVILVEVELPLFQPQIPEGPCWHQTPFYVACPLALILAHNDVIFIGKLLLKPFLLVLLVSVERGANIDSLKGVIGLSEQHSFTIACVCDVKFVVNDYRHDGAAAHVSSLGKAVSETLTNKANPFCF